jgi:hypothetical protein
MIEPIFGRKPVDMMTFLNKESRLLDHVELESGRSEINPAFQLKAKTMYRLQLWDDGTYSLWELVADGMITKIN